MDDNAVKYFIESALLAAGRPLNIDQLQGLFDVDSAPEKSQIRQAVSSLLEDYEDRGFTITEVASGFRMQIEGDMVARLQKLWEERPPRYSRALFETLALIAYRQPMTRGEIEEVRGVAVSTNIIRSLMEREWIRVVGHRDVPGRPAMFGTTKQFLDYFGLKKLDDLPPLADLSDWESLRVQLNLPAVEDGETGPVVENAADVNDIPVLHLEGEDDDGDESDGDTANDVIDIDMALSEGGDVEPIDAVAWPDPSDTSVASLDVDAADDFQGENSDQENEDADASLTGA
jgi:segregation and condensation protein B